MFYHGLLEATLALFAAIGQILPALPSVVALPLLAGVSRWLPRHGVSN